MQIFEKLHRLCDPFFVEMTQNISTE